MELINTNKYELIDPELNTKEYKIILNFIKQIRTNNNLSQRTLAKKLNINYSKYARIEIGKQVIDLPFLLLFLEKFRLKLEILEANNNSNPKIENNANSVIILGNASKSTIDNRQYYSDSPDVLRAQVESLEERVREKDAQIREKDAQISRLLDILSKN